MKLNYKELGSGKPLIILHGLFGSLDNWFTLGKKFAEDYHVFLLDARNHGQSPHSDDFSYDLMADDLREFIVDHHIQSPVVMGHSMGGKMAMVAAMNWPNLVEKLIIVDMAPKSYEIHHRTILDGLLSLDFDQLKSRGEADEALAKYLDHAGVRQFLLKSLYWEEKDKLGLRFNLPVLDREIGPISQWKERSEIYDGPTLFIRGGKSDYLDANDKSISANFPHAKLVTIGSAGHWVHAEAPSELYKIVTDFIEQ